MCVAANDDCVECAACYKVSRLLGTQLHARRASQSLGSAYSTLFQIHMHIRACASVYVCVCAYVCVCVCARVCVSERTRERNATK